MLSREKFSFLLILSLILGFSFSANAADEDEVDVEEVIVTGSRIVDPNIISSSQISIIDWICYLVLNSKFNLY